MYQKVRPVLRADMAVLAKEAVLDLLSDEEVAEFAAKYADALVDREKRRVFGAIGGMQKGINYATNSGKEPLELDLFDDEGNFSLATAVKWFMRNRNKLPSLTSIGGQYNPQSGEQAQNAPD